MSLGLVSLTSLLLSAGCGDAGNDGGSGGGGAGGAGPVAGIVALNQSADLGALVCPEERVACPPCAPVYPEGMTAVCSEGRCKPQPSETP